MEKLQEDDCDLLIVGAGLSGLALATFLRAARPGIRLALLEAGGRAGGAIRSLRQDGFVAEWGAHGFLDNTAPTRELLRISGLEEHCLQAPLGRFVRHICLDGRLREIAQHPLKILLSPLVSFAAKLRVLGELRRPPLAGEPSVAAWVEHRFGKALLPFADAVFTGTYAGDFNRLAIDATFPALRALEQEHGSVLRGLVARARQKKKTGAAKRGLPSMLSFAAGMETLPASLAQGLDIRLQQEALGLERLEQGWRVATGAGPLRATQVALATDLNATLRLLATIKPALRPPPQDAVPVARIAEVALGLGAGARIPAGFGYLAPESEGRFCLGALFSSNMFPGRAPAGQVLIEALVGGRRHPERLELTDAEILRRTLEDLGQLMPLGGGPVWSRVLRPAAGIPQLEGGHGKLLAWRREILAAMPGLHCTGFGWEGIGINDMIKGAQEVAAKIIGQGEQQATTEKGVYF